MRLWLVICGVAWWVAALTRVALPARLSMVALQAVLVSVPPGVPKRVAPPPRLVMLALPAVLLLKNPVSPRSLTIVAVPAVLLPKNDVRPPSLVILVIPAVLALTILNWPSFMTAPTTPPGGVAAPGCSRPHA